MPDPVTTASWVAKILGWTIDVFRWIRRKLLPFYIFLGDFAEPKKPVSVFVRDMKSKDGEYYSLNQDVNTPPDWRNIIGGVVARGDLELAADVLNVLGQAGKATNIFWRKVDSDAKLWSEPLICLGGSKKAYEALNQVCTPKLVQFMPRGSSDGTTQYGVGGFKTVSDGKLFCYHGPNDYAVIYRGLVPDHDVPCRVVFGGGVEGTIAAGYYLRRHAGRLARLYFSKPFAAIIEVGWGKGPDLGHIVWLSYHPSWRAWLFCPFIRYRFRDVIASKNAQP